MTLPPLDHVHAVLDAGCIAVVWLPVAGGIEAVRAQTRAACALLRAAAGPAALHTSRSATAGMGAVALWRGGPLGVDVEGVRPQLIDETLRSLMLHPEEDRSIGHDEPAALFEAWTRKEALLKALGVGLAVAPAGVRVGRGSDAWRRCTVAPHGAACVLSLDAATGFVGAVAAGRPAPTRVWTAYPAQAQPFALPSSQDPRNAGWRTGFRWGY